MMVWYLKNIRNFNKNIRWQSNVIWIKTDLIVIIKNKKIQKRILFSYRLSQIKPVIFIKCSIHVRVNNGRLHKWFKRKSLFVNTKKLLSEDGHSHWAPPYWNIMKETSSLGRTEVKILLLKLSIKCFEDVYKAIKSSVIPNNSSFFPLQIFLFLIRETLYR